MKNQILNFIYNDKEVEFIKGGKNNVMVNATQMAKIFGKNVKHFLRSDHAKEFIEVLKRTPNGGRINDKLTPFGSRISNKLDPNGGNSANEFTPNGGNSSYLSDDEILQYQGRNGLFMHRLLALKFAAWLSPEFELWVYSTIDHVLYEYYYELEESLKRTASIRNKIEAIQEELKDNDRFQELEELRRLEKKEARRRSSISLGQLDLFREEKKLN